MTCQATEGNNMWSGLFRNDMVFAGERRGKKEKVG